MEFGGELASSDADHGFTKLNNMCNQELDISISGDYLESDESGDDNE